MIRFLKPGLIIINNLLSAEEAEEEWVRPLRALQEERESIKAWQREAQVILHRTGLESQFQESLHQSHLQESRHDAAVPITALHRQAQKTGLLRSQGCDSIAKKIF